jgi:hypothetical protein
LSGSGQLAHRARECARQDNAQDKSDDHSTHRRTEQNLIGPYQVRLLPRTERRRFSGGENRSHQQSLYLNPRPLLQIARSNDIAKAVRPSGHHHTPVCIGQGKGKWLGLRFGRDLLFGRCLLWRRLQRW